jgi:hypothetical protein
MDMPEKQATTGQQTTYKVVDCDVHPYVKDGIKSVFPYMPEAWQTAFHAQARAVVGAEARSLKYLHPNGAVNREDARPPCGGVSGSDPHFLVQDLLVKNKIEHAVLNCLQTGALCSTLAGTDESIVLCSAFNDYLIHEWLPVDNRLKFAMSGAVAGPAGFRCRDSPLGKHPQIVSVSLPLINVLMGNRYWWPVYEAAQEMQLASILVHVTGPDSIFYGPPMSAGGIPDSYVERYVTLNQAGESSVNSLVFSGRVREIPVT